MSRLTRMACTWARLCERVEDHVPSTLLALIVVVNAANVVLRYVVGRSQGQLFELMILLSLVVYWIGIAAAERRTGHIGMSFVVDRLRGRARTVAAVARAVVVVGFLLAVAVSGAKLTLSQYHSGTVSGALELRIWWFSAFVPLGALLMAARFLARQARSAEREPAV